jgi:hypothetical protein
MYSNYDISDEDIEAYFNNWSNLKIQK